MLAGARGCPIFTFTGPDFSPCFKASIIALPLNESVGLMVPPVATLAALFVWPKGLEAPERDPTEAGVAGEEIRGVAPKFGFGMD